MNRLKRPLINRIAELILIASLEVLRIHSYKQELLYHSSILPLYSQIDYCDEKWNIALTSEGRRT